MNNPAHEEKMNNLAIEAKYAREYVASAADEVINGRDVNAAAEDWGVPVSEVKRFLEEK